MATGRLQSGLKIRGVANVLRNLNREMTQIKLRSVKGMLVAADIVRKDMDKTPPLIPVDTGRLRKSWYAEVRQGISPIVEMGFKANYALFVHEAPKKYKRPGSGNKFFQASLSRNMDEMVLTIAALAKIK